MTNPAGGLGLEHCRVLGAGAGGGGRAGRALSAVTLELMSERIRVVIAKPGLDGHDRGAKIVARALRDAGMEVIYTGLHQTPEQIVQTVLQEDADAVGLSVLSGAHLTLFARVIELLAGKGASDVLVFGGGIIPEQDIPELTRMGVARVFTPGTPTREIVEWVRQAVTTAQVQ
jgi:methylmalonyl-CoA mutase C-terminal domain/subunit